MKINKVDMEKAGAFAEEVKKDRSKALKVKRIEVNWNLEDGKVQFAATLEHPQGSTVVEADGPPFLGGSGIKPDPVQYCLFGLAACYAQSFASIAAERGIKLKQLKVATENKVNLSRALGLSNEPIVEKVILEVNASAEKGENLSEVKKLAEQRCPGVYCLTNAIKLEIK